MPLIRRKIFLSAESTFSGAEHEHELYVPARKVQKGDVVIDVANIPDSQLADLAHAHPKEFAKAALERGVLEIESDEDLDEDLAPAADDDDAIVFTEEQEQFQAMESKEAAKLVKAAANDPEKLALYAEAEEGKEKPRKAVLDALAAALSA